MTRSSLYTKTASLGTHRRWNDAHQSSRNLFLVLTEWLQNQPSPNICAVESVNVNVMENQGCLRRLLNLEINLFLNQMHCNSFFSGFALCIEHGCDAEKTQIEIGNTFIIPDIVTV